MIFQIIADIFERRRSWGARRVSGTGGDSMEKWRVIWFNSEWRWMVRSYHARTIMDMRLMQGRLFERFEEALTRPM